MNKRCILIRHAKTDGNETGRFMGCRTDEPLSDNGRQEAGVIKEKIAEIAGDNFSLYVSPLIRAVETAQILFGTKELTEMSDLKELDFGIMDGHTHAELDGDPRYQAWIDSGGRDRIPGGESMDDLIRRSMSGFEQVIRLTPEDNDIVIVCHGGNIMSVMSTLAGNDFYANICPNLDGYVLDLEINDERIDLLSYDRISDRLRA